MIRSPPQPFIPVSRGAETGAIAMLRCG